MTNNPKRKEKQKRAQAAEQQIRDAVKNSRSYSSILKQLGLSPSGANYKWIKHQIRDYEIDTGHMTGQGWTLGMQNPIQNLNARPLSEVLVENSDYRSTNSLKKKLLKAGLLKYKCKNCGINKWRDKPLSLQLDHINGVNDDNRIENLRLLCPNCHAQTETFAGANQAKATRKTYPGAPVDYKYYKDCVDCNTPVSPAAARCSSCAAKYRHKAIFEVSCCHCSKPIGKRDKPRVACRHCAGLMQDSKIAWPGLKELQNMVSEQSYLAVGKELGVSDNAVRKHIKLRLELEKRPMQYGHPGSK